jgi:putative ABC transport system ATP-binding protein
MQKEQIEALLRSLEEDYHGDLELLLSDIREKVETNKQKSGKNQKENGNVLISINNISKEYKVGKETVKALKEVSLDIYEGEILALVGPSGSGKSTLLHLIGGLDTPDTGEISFGEIALHTLKDKALSSYRNETIGFVFQFFNLQQYLNVRENVEVPLIFRGEKPNAREKAAQEAVEAVGLSERITHLPNQLSGGQMQRVAIARSLVNKPKLILADEPTGNLDRNTGIEIIDLIKKLNKDFNTTVIIVTHDSFIASKADRVVKLSDGRII